MGFIWGLYIDPSADRIRRSPTVPLLPFEQFIPIKAARDIGGKVRHSPRVHTKVLHTFGYFKKCAFLPVLLLLGSSKVNLLRMLVVHPHTEVNWRAVIDQRSRPEIGEILLVSYASSHRVRQWKHFSWP